jgi:chromosome segregation ATPase
MCQVRMTNSLIPMFALFPSASEDDGDADGDGDDEGLSPVTTGQQEARKEIALPGMAGGGLRYPLHAQDFYDHMLFNANLTLQTDKSWRYWSRIRVRDEVYYMLQKVKNLIIRNYDMHYNVKQDVASDRTFAKEDVELAQAKMTALVGEVKGVAEKVAAGLTNLRKSEEEEQRRLEQYKRHYDTDLRRIHAVLGNQTVELEKERHDSLRKAYDAELSKMQKNVDDILAEDRSQMVETEDEAKEKIQGIQTQLNTDVNDMSNLQSTILNNVGDVQKKEETDFNNVTSVHASIESYLKTMQQQLHDSSLKQQSTDALAKSNEEQLTHVTTEVNSAAFKLSMLEKKQAEDHNEVNDKLQGLATSTTGLESSLTTQTELIDKLKTTVDNFATENAAFKETVTGDHASLGVTIANLQTELTKTDVLKKDIQDLQTSMSTQINDLSSKIDDLGIKQSTLDTSVGHQKTDMAELQTRVAQLEVTSKAASDEAKSDHDQVSAVVEEMQAKLSVLLDLKV